MNFMIFFIEISVRPFQVFLSFGLPQPVGAELKEEEARFRIIVSQDHV